MPKPAFQRPLQEFDRGDEARLEPPAKLHDLRREPFSPAPSAPLREIHERAFVDIQTAELSEHPLSGGGNESVPNPRRISEIVALVVPDQDRIEGVRARHVAADHKFLSAVSA